MYSSVGTLFQIWDFIPDCCIAPHTSSISTSADIQSTSTTANAETPAETSPIVHVDTSNEHVELAEVPPPPPSRCI